jgi:hypothetical protein
MYKNLHFIIVGGKNNTNNFNDNEIETWNNNKQVCYNDLNTLIFILKEKYDIDEISFDIIDGAYPFNKHLENINFYADNFFLDSGKYLKENSLNIIIEFCNLLNENWIAWNSADLNLYDKIKNYKIILLACGCCWNEDLPINLIIKILDLKLYTSIEPFNHLSYLDIINFINIIKKNNIFEIMKPFIRGNFMIMGTLIYRNNKTEDVIRNLLELNNPFNNEEITLFINKKKHWNELPRNIRIEFCYHIYNMETDYQI